jgi:hypothetical protein
MGGNTGQPLAFCNKTDLEIPLLPRHLPWKNIEIYVPKNTCKNVYNNTQNKNQLNSQQSDGFKNEYVYGITMYTMGP